MTRVSLDSLSPTLRRMCGHVWTGQGTGIVKIRTIAKQYQDGEIYLCRGQLWSNARCVAMYG